MKAVVLLGPPGAGKGTTAEGIKVATDYEHVATGDMLREAVKQKTAVGQEAESYMNKGELVPDDVIGRLVEERLDSGDGDGFPRTPEQARVLAAAIRKRGGRIDRVFFLDAPRDVLVNRLTGRRICRECGTNFHVVNIPPKEDGACDRCGGELYQRPDDMESTINNRLDVYEKQTESLIAFYEREGNLLRIDAAQHRDAIVAEVAAVLESLSES